MSRTVAYASLARVARVAAIMLAAAVVTGAPGCDRSGPWPRESSLVESVDNAVAARLPGSDALIFSGGRVWAVAEESFIQRAVYSDEYAVAHATRPTGGPMLGGAQSLGDRAVFLRHMQEQSAETSGAAALKDYEEVVLIDPQEPSDREVVCRIKGAVDDIRCFESSDASVQAVALSWKTSGGAPTAYGLFVRSADGEWSRVWLHVQDQTAPFAIHAWGFAGGDAASDPALCIVADTDRSMEGRSLTFLRVDLSGSVAARKLPFADVTSVEYLCTYRQDDRDQVAFVLRRETGGGKQDGLLVTDSATDGFRVVDTGGTPLLVASRDDGGPLVIARAPTAAPGELQVMPLNDIANARTIEGATAHWAALYAGPEGEPTIVVLVGSERVGDSDKWDVWAVDVERASVGEPRGIITGWKVPHDGGAVLSIDGVFADSPEVRSLVVGLQVESESALVVVPLDR